MDIRSHGLAGDIIIGTHPTTKMGRPMTENRGGKKCVDGTACRRWDGVEAVSYEGRAGSRARASLPLSTLSTPKPKIQKSCGCRRQFRTKDGPPSHLCMNIHLSCQPFWHVSKRSSPPPSGVSYFDNSTAERQSIGTNIISRRQILC